MKEPLVFLPEMMCDAGVFAPQIAALSRERAIHVAALGDGDRVEKIAQQVLAHAPERFALAGLSFGGGVAMEIQRRAPERVSRLALMDTTALAEPSAVSVAREPGIVLAKSGQLDQALHEFMRPEFLAQGPRRNEILDRFMAMARAMGPEAFVRHSRALQRRPDQQKTLRKLKIPTLILCGEQDRMTPPIRHEFMASLVLGARLEIIPGAGHFPTLEQPETVNRLLSEWLAEPLTLRP